ncbi:putative Mg2+ transporter-C (MgtC) family protein [Lachnotalea glycerini]|jgi:putative Mg2+ transporter-C (MgtC) family protein|uniref:MgtC/SapB family protein n=1 Tax=Lachnotalea glycerini TaxID=1763509 RepID=A0A255IPP8_9FIRM|nr:MgtC/SapB family protein [Lachnotalea glycerini]PXV87731.1 putative Mg2+ transporter-C (MgtC) family protein [Lachnotalea glycerini]RDY32099.1 MgtC/SapB family protein [Lachnotalea glycerini]
MLQEINIVSVCIRVLLSVLIGGFLGMERGRKNRPAGFRTYILVCLGSTLVMMTNQYVYQKYHISDPVRMGAQVVSGIGFLGAGSIIVTGRHQIRGITTAAGLWSAACCGLAIGIGFYEGAIVGGIAILIVMAAMESVDDMIRSRSTVMELYLEFNSKKPFSVFIEYARDNKLEIKEMEISKSKLAKNMDLCAVITINSQIRRNRESILEIISSFPGINYIEEL